MTHHDNYENKDDKMHQKENKANDVVINTHARGVKLSEYQNNKSINAKHNM